MKTMKRIQYLLLGALVMLSAACKEEEPLVIAPTAITGEASDIYRLGATLSGNIQNPHNASVKEVGIQFSELQSMAEYDELKSATVSGSAFSVSVSSLSPGQTYYYRAYASSGASMVTGEVKSFTTTQSNAPVFGEVYTSNLTEQSVNVSTSILDEGGSELVLSGFCWKAGDGEPTAQDNVVNATLSGSTLQATIDGLAPGQIYSIRPYGVNSSGVGYGTKVTIVTQEATIPVLSKIEASDSTEVSITVKASVVDKGAGEVTKFGFCYSSENKTPTTEHLVIEKVSGDSENFGAIIEGLTPETTYYIRAYAESEHGIGYSEVLVYTTPEAPLIEGSEGDVYVAEAGGLSKFIDDSNKYNITKLKVSGYLNGDDIRLIREMAGRDIDGNETAGRLVDLDISETTIVAGGYYYKLYATKNDEIGDNFFYETKLEVLELPVTANIIRITAFKNCTALTSITLPSTLSSIGDFAFSGCSSLVSIEIPDGITSISIGAFSSCTSLESISIPKGITMIERSTFGGCSSLISVEIPKEVKMIDEGAFYNCSSLTSIVLPDGLETIGGSVFERCSSLKDITIPEGVTSIGTSAFMDCSLLASVILPESLTEIGMQAFTNCSSLTNVTIPEGVTTIGERAFMDCTDLTKVTCNATTPPTLGTTAFAHQIYDTATLYVPSDCEGVYKASDWATYFAVIDDGVEGGSYANGLAILEEAGMLATLIPEDEKYTITSLKVVGPLNGDDIRFIREMAGRDVNGNETNGRLVDLDISEAMIVEGGDAYYDAHYTENDVVGNNMFERTILNQVFLPDNVTSISSSTFARCTSLTSIDIPEAVTMIGDSAFFYCTSLTTIDIPDKVTSIGSSAFDYCSSLASVIIPNGVTSIESGAFQYCFSLTSITIPDGVTSIANHTFFVCSSLASITIPEGVTYIGHSAFRECSSLTKVTCKATTPPGLEGLSVFSGIASDRELIVPTGCATAYSESNWGYSFTTITEQ